MRAQDVILAAKGEGYKVSVRHYRRIWDPFGRQHLIATPATRMVGLPETERGDLLSTVHEIRETNRASGIPFEVAPTGGRTEITVRGRIASLLGEGEFEVAGYAICSDRDTFNKTIGLNIAAGRVLAAYGEMVEEITSRPILETHVETTFEGYQLIDETVIAEVTDEWVSGYQGGEVTESIDAIYADPSILPEEKVARIFAILDSEGVETIVDPLTFEVPESLNAVFYGEPGEGKTKATFPLFRSGDRELGDAISEMFGSPRRRA